MVSGVLADAGYAVETAADGVEALKKAIERRPRIAVIDVGLPGIYVFELCERLRENPQTGGLKIILLASVYDVSRYKRTPVSFYGADDYIEKHEVAESLVRKIHALLSPEETPATEAPSPSPAPVAAAPRPVAKKTAAEDEDLSGLFREVMGTASASAGSGAPVAARSWPGDSLPPAQDGTVMAPESFSLDSSVFDQKVTAASAVQEKDPDAVQKARRLARIIVSDIALYNQEAVVEGIRNGTFFDLLKEDVEEGRRLYEQRIPASIRSAQDYYQDAFDAFIEAQKKNLR
jgi:CheY-like chemotaxis protein